MVHKAFALLVLSLAAELPGKAAAQFNLKSLDPSRLGHVLQTFGKQGDKVVQVLEKPGAQKAVVEALHHIEPAKAAAAANTIRAAATNGGWRAGLGSPTANDGLRHEVDTPTDGTHAGDVVSRGSSKMPVPLGASQQQVEHLLQKAPGDALAAVLKGDVPKAIAGFLQNARLRKDLEVTLKRETPKLASSLKQVDLKEAEELLKHANAKEINEALHLLHEYHWWQAHWHVVVGAIVSVCISLVALSVIFRKLFFYRLDKHSSTVELSTWLPRRQAECVEAGFQQF